MGNDKSRAKSRAKQAAKRAEKKKSEAARQLQQKAKEPVRLPIVQMLEDRSPDFRAASVAVRAALRGGADLERIKAATNAVGQLIDGIKVPGAACARGCFYCCHVIVHLGLAELAELVGFIRQNFTEDQVAELRDRARATAATTHGTDALSYPIKTPCTLLRDGACSVYPARPHACRTEHSLSVEPCRKAYEAPQGVDVYEDTRNFEVKMRTDVMRPALEAALAERGLSTRSYELQEALAIALEQPDAFDRWLKGEDVFEPALSGIGVLGTFLSEFQGAR